MPLPSTVLVPLQGDPGAAFGLFFLLVIAGVLFGVALWGAIAYFIYRDAQKHDVDSPALWGAVVFVTGVVGILVYFLVRD